MYSTLYTFTEGVKDFSNQRIFAPIVGAMKINTMKIAVNGVSYAQGFKIDGCWLVFNREHFGSRILTEGGEVALEVDYFYKSDVNNLLNSVVDSTYKFADKTKEILSQHYIDGHFSLDNGLYKEAVINFGVVVEALVNRKMSTGSLCEKIRIDKCAEQDKSIQLKMLDIKKLRNRVHPNRIAEYGAVNREDAYSARFNLQEIMYHYYKSSRSYEEKS